MCFSVLHRLRIIDFKSRRVSARGVMFFAAAAQPQCRSSVIRWTNAGSSATSTVHTLIHEWEPAEVNP